MKSLSSRAAIVLSPAERRAVSSKSKSEKAEKRRKDVLAKAEKRANALSKKLGRSVAILGARGRAVHESRAGAPHTKQVALPRSKKKNPATEVVCVATKPNPGSPVPMMNGYAFELDGQDWKKSPDDDWAIEVYTPTGEETLVGKRRIDGAAVAVFACPDGTFRAQTLVSLGVRA